MGTVRERGTAFAQTIVNDCWNKIGVHGDSSCPELRKHVHCRNCPVYGTAASGLLDRDLPSGHIDEATRHFALARNVDELDTASMVIFRIGGEWLGLPTAVFSEVVDVRPIHSLPHRRDGVVLGLTNVRGELLVCVSLERVMGIEREEAKSQKRRQGAVYRRLAVVREKDRRIAFPVDEVHGIHKFSPGQLKEVPATVAKAAATYTRAMLPWKDMAVGYLDEQLLFYTLNRSLA